MSLFCPGSAPNRNSALSLLNPNTHYQQQTVVNMNKSEQDLGESNSTTTTITTENSTKKADEDLVSANADQLQLTKNNNNNNGSRSGGSDSLSSLSMSMSYAEQAARGASVAAKFVAGSPSRVATLMTTSLSPPPVLLARVKIAPAVVTATPVVVTCGVSSSLSKNEQSEMAKGKATADSLKTGSDDFSNSSNSSNSSSGSKEFPLTSSTAIAELHLSHGSSEPTLSTQTPESKLEEYHQCVAFLNAFPGTAAEAAAASVQTATATAVCSIISTTAVAGGSAESVSSSPRLQRKLSANSLMPRRVSFPKSDNELVTGYLEPADPWQHGKSVK